jgi:hypothetical protein
MTVTTPSRRIRHRGQNPPGRRPYGADVGGDDQRDGQPFDRGELLVQDDIAGDRSDGGPKAHQYGEGRDGHAA